MSNHALNTPSRQTRPPRARYRREIDGLRAVAVLPVILFHAGFSTFSGGFVGVDVFFVISGYLITGLIAAELETGTFSLAAFYERRARRILPALFLVVLVCLPAAFLWMAPGDLATLGNAMTAVAIFASNVLFYRTSGYFDPDADLNPLLHTWSLAVEEQYYVFYPLLLWVVWRLGRPLLLFSLSLGFILSLVAAQWASRVYPPAAFYLLPTRGWELLLGGLVALWQLPRADPAHIVSELASAAGLAMIIGAVFLFNALTPSPSIYTVIPTFGTALILMAATPATLVGRLLGTRLLVGIGLVSYSAYLWHQPLIAFVTYTSPDEPSRALLGALCAMSLLLAVVSWKLVESPFRDRTRFSRSHIFRQAVVGSVIMLMLGLLVSKSGGFESYYYNSRLTPLERQNYRFIKEQSSGYNLYDRMVDDGNCTYWSADIDETLINRFEHCGAKYEKAIVVVGDSHAMNAYNIVAKTGIRPFVVGISKGGCRPQRNLPTCQYDRFLSFLRSHGAAVELVMFHQSGAYLYSGPDGVVYIESQYRREIDEFHLDSTAVAAVEEYLNQLSGLAPVVWLGPYKEAGVSFADVRRFDSGFRMDERRFVLFTRANAELARLQGSAGRRYHFVPFEDLFEIDRQFLKVGDCLTYFNADHFTACGEDLIAPHFARQFARFLRPAGLN